MARSFWPPARVDRDRRAPVGTKCLGGSAPYGCYRKWCGGGPSSR